MKESNIGVHTSPHILSSRFVDETVCCFRRRVELSTESPSTAMPSQLLKEPVQLKDHPPQPTQAIFMAFKSQRQLISTYIQLHLEHNNRKTNIQDVNSTR